MRLIPILLLLISIPAADALSQEGTERLIRDVGWTYDQFWNFYSTFGEDVFTTENATVLPLAYAVDNQTLRVWPIVLVPVDWAFMVVDCTEILVFGGEPINALACTLTAPGPDLTPVDMLIAYAPAEATAALGASMGGATNGTRVIVDHSGAWVQLVATRWETDILALRP